MEGGERREERGERREEGVEFLLAVLLCCGGAVWLFTGVSGICPKSKLSAGFAGNKFLASDGEAMRSFSV